MFRRCNAVVLGRPWGPLATKHFPMKEGVNLSEKVMANERKGPIDFQSMRRTAQYPLRNSKRRAIPRDIGAVPRDYVLRLLAFNQPCTVDSLWTLAKADDFCPLDSKHHMKSVLKIAGLQGWVLYEKNQTNNNYYAKIHPGKAKEAQELLYQHRQEVEQAERTAAAERAAVADETRERRLEALDMAIHMAQMQLVNCVVKLQEHNPEVLQRLPCVTPEGAINFHFYAPERKASATSGGGAAPTGAAADGEAA